MNRVEQVKKIQEKAALEYAEYAKRKRDAKARNILMSEDVVSYKKGKCKCQKGQH